MKTHRQFLEHMPASRSAHDFESARVEASEARGRISTPPLNANRQNRIQLDDPPARSDGADYTQ